MGIQSLSGEEATESPQQEPELPTCSQCRLGQVCWEWVLLAPVGLEQEAAGTRHCPEQLSLSQPSLTQSQCLYLTEG